MRLLEASSVMWQGFESARDLLFGLSSGLPECMIVDLQMPNMTGLELQHHLARTGIRFRQLLSRHMTKPAPENGASPLELQLIC